MHRLDLAAIQVTLANGDDLVITERLAHLEAPEYLECQDLLDLHQMSVKINFLYLVNG